MLDEYSFLVSETDDKGFIKFANNDFCQIAGYTIEELMGVNHN
ncbi:MAG: PAS domain S-box protein, partial [Arcobacteraceae bacterium]